MSSDPWQDAAIVRQCKSCGRWRSINSYGARHHTCAICRNLHYRSYVLTEKGLGVIKEPATA